MAFQEMPIDSRCLQILEKQNILEPTPVQAAAIPPALDGRDVIAIAQTGTGKTLAFGLPVLQKLKTSVRGKSAVLILAPTRELARQVHDVLQPFVRAMKRNSVCIYGGSGYKPQTDALRRGASLIVATPGRFIDHLNRGNCRLDNLAALVLDEADRMLDMGFMPDIKRIMEELPAERQTLLFSATFPANVERLASGLLNDPVRLELAPSSSPVESVRQSLYAVTKEEKNGLLTNLLSCDTVQSAVIFVRTKHGADRLAKSLTLKDFSAEAIHGDHSQNKRQRTIDAFRRGKRKILVATDVASRGLDVKGITHVFNYDLPDNCEDYVHRIGRTARANTEGDAISFVSPGQESELRAIERTIGRDIARISWDGEVELRSARSEKPKAKKSFSKGKGQFQRNSFRKRRQTA